MLYQNDQTDNNGNCINLRQPQASLNKNELLRLQISYSIHSTAVFSHEVIELRN